MRVAWLGALDDGREALVKALSDLGWQVLAGDEQADVRLLSVGAGPPAEGVAESLRSNEAPTLLLAATPAGEALAQRLARVQDDVALLDDAPQSLAHRLQRLLQRAQQRTEARRSLQCDALTGLLNRSALQAHAESVLESLLPEAVVGFQMLDLDHFKRINDQHGHVAGDAVLVATAACLRAVLGEAVPVFRLGGEEFAWICHAPSLAEFDSLAARALAALRVLDIRLAEGGTVRITASIGWTRLARGMTLAEAWQEADQALYDAKAKGRDQVRSWQDMHAQAAVSDADVQLTHFQNVAKVVSERATNLVTLFGKGLIEQARRAADQDRLTQLWNRGYFDRRLAREVAMSQRDGRPLSIVMMDLDHFGQFNKDHGLPTGDAVLRGFAAVAARHVRAVDWFARYGGEEFALVLPGSLEEAALVAERIRQAVQDTHIDVPRGQAVRVTVSIGVATLEAVMAGPVDLVQRASDALQAAKRAGRNRVAA